jgi:probable F420-dependent oxidoreductase
MAPVGQRRFRFGVRHTSSTLEEGQRIARKAEDLGFSTLVVQDHVDKQLAPLLALMSAAAVTSTLRLGTVVLNNDFRHPAILAKEAATVDVLTNGRLELGLGAGWLLADYQQIGLSFDAPGERLARLAETVQICKAFFTEETVTFHGKYYQIEALDAFPTTTQKPHPPIMIGGRQRRMLSLAARQADIVSISMLDPRGPGLPQPPTYAEKVRWVREAAGARYSHIELHVNVSHVEVTAYRQAALAQLAARLQIAPQDVLQSPTTLVGSVDAIVEQLHAWREQCDVSYFIVPSRLMGSLTPVIARAVGT